MGTPGTQSKRRAPGKRPARRRGSEAGAGSKGAGKQRHKRGLKTHGTQRAKGASAPQRLIAAAQELVEEHGYESLAVGAVWKRAGISHQTFYNHFRDKRAVICAAEHEDLAAIDAAVRRAQRRGDPWAAELSRSLERALADLYGSTDTPRARLVAAMSEIAATEGIKAASVHRLTRTAGVSAGDFQHYFSDRYDCLGAAVCQAVRRTEERLAVTPQGDEPTIVAARLIAALIDSLAAEPQIATILLAEAGALSSPPHEGRGATGDGPRGWAGSLRELIETRALAPLADLPQALRKIAAGGIVAALRSVNLAEGTAGLREARAEIASAGLSPLIGAEAARRAVERAFGPSRQAAVAGV